MCCCKFSRSFGAVTLLAVSALVVWPVEWASAQHKARQAANCEHKSALSASDAQVVELLCKGASPQEQKIIRCLYEPIDLDFTDVPLEEVRSFLADKLDVNVVLLGESLRDVGVDSSVPITFHCRGMRLKSALTLLLRRHDLMYTVEDDALQFTAYEDAESHLIIRVYEVSDLIERRDAPQPQAAPQRKTREQYREQSFCEEPTRDQLDAHLLGFKQLLDTIETVVAPDWWDVSGGPGSQSPLIVNGQAMLSVYQTWDIQMQIAAFLVQLRELSPQPTIALPAVNGGQQP